MLAGKPRAPLAFGKTIQRNPETEHWLTGYAVLERGQGGLIAASFNRDLRLSHSGIGKIVEELNPVVNSAKMTISRYEYNGISFHHNGSIKKMANEFGKRLKQARKYRKLTQVRLGELMGVPQSTISSAEIFGTASTSTAQYAATLAVNAQWLATGEGDMLSASAQALPELTKNDEKLSYLALDLARMLDTLKDEKKKRILHAHCIMLLTENPVFMRQVGLAPAVVDPTGETAATPSRQAAK